MTELETNLRNILNEKETKILPENIKKDVQIFDTVGTLEAGTEINNQDKTITTNGTYTADEGYTGLGTVTVNVPQEDLQEQLDNQDLIIQQLQEELAGKASGGSQLSYSELFALVTSIYDTGIADDSETANFTIDDETRKAIQELSYTLANISAERIKVQMYLKF